MKTTKKKLILLMATLSISGWSAFGAMPAIVNVGDAEFCGDFSGTRPSIAVDSLNQPHIVIDWGSSARLWKYHKIDGAWSQENFATGTRGGNYDAGRLYMPHIEIDQYDRAWISCKFGCKEWGTMGGQGLWCFENITNTPTLRLFQWLPANLTSMGNGNVALDPFKPNEAIVLASGGNWARVSDAPKAINRSLDNVVETGNLSLPGSGEKVKFRIAPRTGQVGVWHQAMGGYSQAPSAYRNSLMGGGVIWANHPPYNYGSPRMGEDMVYPGIGFDLENPEICYIAVEYDAGIMFNIWNGTQMVFPNTALPVVDDVGHEHSNRFGPQWAPAPNGGAWLVWKHSGRVKLLFVDQNGTTTDPFPGQGDPNDLCAGNYASMCTDSEGNLHIAYVSGGMRYRKIDLAGLYLNGPRGRIEELRPTFSWGDSMEPAATSYNLWLVQTDFTPQSILSTNLPAGTSNFTGLAADLDVGRYEWYLTRFWSGTNKVVGPQSFEVIPGESALLYPTNYDKIYSTNELYFSWAAVPGADRYHLWVHGPDGYVTNFWLTGASATNWTPTQTDGWACGVYRWWIQSARSDLIGDWYESEYFEIAVPATAQLISPTGTMSVTNDLQFEWTAQDTASNHLYILRDDQLMWEGWLLGSGTTWTPAGVGGQPTLADFEPGEYRWWLRTANSFGCGEWSLAAEFSRARAMSPDGGVTNMNPRPQFTWSASSSATRYYVWIGRNGLSYHSEWLEQTTNTWTPDFDLGGGDYTWWIQAWDAVSGYGPWLSPGSFSVPYRIPTDKPTLIAPSGTIATNRPQFSWGSVTNATRYSLWITKDGVSYLSLKVEGQTTYVPVSNLPLGSYTWLIRPEGPDGDGPWSDPMDFSFGVAMQISPTGTVVATRTPVFSWTRVDAATHYRMWLNKGSTHITNFWQAGVDATNWVPAADLAGGDYHWWIQIWNPDGFGPWSLQANFTIPPALPGLITPVAPLGPTSAGPVDYIWDADPAATWYQLWIDNAQGHWHDEWHETGMRTGQITNTIPGHTTGSYSWWIRAYGPDGMGPWTTPTAHTFTIP